VLGMFCDSLMGMWRAGVLLPAVQEGETFTFCMCNPPFFASIEEAGQNPSTAYAGTTAEMVCPGGEMAFVSQMVADSFKLRVRIL
jgi:23S rRNA (adenine1618-N6)-methyltransferase